MRKNFSRVYCISFILLSVLVASLITQSASTQSSAIVKVETPSTSPIGEAFTITLSIGNVQNLYGVDVMLKWNPTILQVANIDLRLGIESFADGILHESSNTPVIFVAENNLTQNTGEYRLVATSMAPASPFSGNGNIVKITFNPISTGNSVLDLETELSDYPPANRDPRTSFLIQHSTQDSSIVVTRENNNKSSTPQPSDHPATPNPTIQQPSSTPSPTATPNQQKTDFNVIPFFVLITAIIIVSVFTVFLILKKGHNKKK